MARVAYVMLAHEDPHGAADHAELILAADPTAWVLIHYDGNAPDSDYSELRARVAGNGRALLLADRVRCGWGEFGLVQAPLIALREIARRKLQPDYVYLLSGACLPIRPLAELSRFLDENNGAEFIQVRDESWMLAGLRRERYEFFFPLSFKRQRRLFNGLVRAQRWLKVRRAPPDGLQPRFGSQWWCLSWVTCRAILAYLDGHPEVSRFFRLTWIPDESFFQTLVHRLADPGRIADKTLTLYQFSDKGKPIVFFDEHERWLRGQNFFFARKIAPDATELKRRLAEIATAPDRGAPFHEIGTATPFYAAAQWLAAERDRPGQMFRADQRLDAFPGPLSRNRKPYIVLFGPGPVTRVAAARLRREGASVLGRLFHRKRVGFGDYGEELPGLTVGDVAVRDFDPSLYLCRVLDRAPPLPVLEVSPVDALPGLRLTIQDPNCLFLACLPHPDIAGYPADWDAATWRLFLALGVLDQDSGWPPQFSRTWIEQIEGLGDDRLWPYELHRIVGPHLGSEVARLMEENIVGAGRRANILVLPWGAGAAGRDTLPAETRRARSRWRDGPLLPPGALEGAALAVADLEIADLELAGPSALKDLLLGTLRTPPAMRPAARGQPDVVPFPGKRP